MPLDDIAGYVKTLRRAPLGAAAEQVLYAGADLLALLPHRPPFLLIDAVTAVDTTTRTIRGVRRIAPDDPVFTGHFPEEPLYPGVLQIEMMGQLGVCLGALLTGARPPRLVMTKVLHAAFFAPVRPGAALTIHAAVAASDELVTVTAGQIYIDTTLAAVALQEGCHVD
jgi:3-hydroxymyristoyl/3-hydroxydecanoyl-(acyl carrier protein) dehydratase